MTDETIWVLKVFFKIFVLAFLVVMVSRIWNWMDDCVVNKIYTTPPGVIGDCNINPFDIRDNYIDNLIEKLEHRSVTEDWAQPR